MSATIINGKKIADDLIEITKLKVDEIRQKHSKVPSLKVIIVGEDPTSSVYVSHKDKS